MPLPGARYRYKKGTKIRLAFRGNQVVEATNMKTGATHTPEEFEADKTRQSKPYKQLMSTLKNRK